ncbi:MAG: Fe-S-containing protein [Endomicrobium sp.]|jgi:uncharacterized membrane protein|nr:Fe-S-containing protein [Endomicrobium sp.]
MIKPFIYIIQILLSSALFAALVYAIVCAAQNLKFIRKKYYMYGCFAGVVLAFIFAMIQRNTAGLNREYFNIAVLSVNILSAVCFIAFLWNFLKKKAPKFYKAAYNFSYAVLTASLFLYVFPDVFLYPFNFVMAGESVVSTDFLFKLAGYAGGGLIVLLTAWALFKAFFAMPYKPARILFTAIAALTIAQQSVSLFQLLLARRIITVSRYMFHILLPVINNQIFFLYAVLAITVPIAFFLFKKGLTLKEEYSNPAQLRKIKVKARSYRRWSAILAAGCVLSVLSLTALKSYDERAVELSPAEPMTISGDIISIAIENIDDGHLHRFAYYAQDGTEVRFIVIKKNDIAYGVGLDACDICGETGYYERNNEVICKLCDVVMNKSTIGFKGGCNPVPLSYTRRGSNMIIQTADLEKEKGRFR